MADDEVVTLAPDVRAAEDLVARIDDTVLRRRADARCLRQSARSVEARREACQAKGALLVAVFTEAVSLGLVKPPGAMGADIVVGEGQSIGNSLNFGGPYVGLFATQAQISAPDAGAPRGETVDADGTRVPSS